MKVIGVLIAGAALLCASASARTADSTSLVINQRIGDIHIGESEAAVGYDYGALCLAGCPGKQDGELPGLTFFSYRQHGGTLRLALWRKHVAYLSTTSPYYHASNGLRVGTKIPFGSRWRNFFWHDCGSGVGYWVSSRNSLPFTQLDVTRGRVTAIEIYGKHANAQEC